MLRRSVGRPPPEPVLKAVAPEKSPVRGVVELLGICRTHLNPGARGAAEFAAPKPAGGAAEVSRGCILELGGARRTHLGGCCWACPEEAAGGREAEPGGPPAASADGGQRAQMIAAVHWDDLFICFSLPPAADGEASQRSGRSLCLVRSAWDIAGVAQTFVKLRSACFHVTSCSGLTSTRLAPRRHYCSVWEPAIAVVDRSASLKSPFSANGTSVVPRNFSCDWLTGDPL